MTTNSTDTRKRTHPTDTRDKAHAMDSMNNTGSDRTMASRPEPSPLRGNRKPWTPWQDWVNVVLGLYLVLAPMWTAGAPVGWFVTLGILAMAVGLWAAGTGSSSAAEWSQLLVGIVLFLAPWFGNFAAASAAATASAGAWTAWIIGPALVVLATTAMYQNRQAEPHTPTYA